MDMQSFSGDGEKDVSPSRPLKSWGRRNMEKNIKLFVKEQPDTTHREGDVPAPNQGGRKQRKCNPHLLR
jgi:hypothetical protein